MQISEKHWTTESFNTLYFYENQLNGVLIQSDYLIFFFYRKQNFKSCWFKL